MKNPAAHSAGTAVDELPFVSGSVVQSSAPGGVRLQDAVVVAVLQVPVEREPQLRLVGRA